MMIESNHACPSECSIVQIALFVFVDCFLVTIAVFWVKNMHGKKTAAFSNSCTCPFGISRETTGVITTSLYEGYALVIMHVLRNCIEYQQGPSGLVQLHAW